ncbi:FAD-dependent oxidoreductase [Bauldia sp.]|uniref:FAD-dependent oxidoreductase n=1 Tax=Bauldia sp. TaxID=2575872 RepID=UPI003BAD704E
MKTLRIVRPGVVPNGPRVSFTFDGAPIEAYAGETIASALAASGIAAIRTHEIAGPDGLPQSRGLYCGMGACYDCVVTVDGRAGQRACLTHVAGGEVVRSVPPAGTADDPLQPLAVEPAGKLPERKTDILVIGAGPAGLAAALAARRAGAAVIVLDERPQSGGQYYKPVAKSHTAAGPPDRQFAEGEVLVDAVRDAGVEIVQAAIVWGAFASDEIIALVDGRAVVFRPRRLVLATGAYERAAPFPGWTLPGVMTAGAAQTLARAYQVAAGRRVLVAGNGPLNFQLAADLAENGIEVVAVVESAPKPSIAAARNIVRAVATDPTKMREGAGYLLRLRRHRVPILWSQVVARARGDRRVSTVTTVGVAADGRALPGSEQDHAVDALCVGYGFMSSIEIGNALGCRTRLDRHGVGALSLAVSDDGETSVAGVFAVGDGASVAGADVAQASGTIAGIAATRQLGYETDTRAALAARRRRDRARRFQDALWSLFQAPPVHLDTVPDETVLCRCEDLSFGAVRRDIDAGSQSLAVLKRRTRLGMGRCQGRYCAPLAAKLLSEMTGRPRDVEDGFAPRLPAKPFPGAALSVEKREWGGHRRAGSPDLSRPLLAPPFGDVETEVAVIGGGVVGACVAFELARAGRDVVLLERDDANLQASGANAGSLHVQLLSFDFGDKAEAGGGPAADTLALGPWAVSLWQALAETCGHDFEIRVTGGLMVAETDAGMAFLEAKAALERRHGVEAEIIGRNELRSLAPALSERLIGAEYAPQEGKINPLTATYRVLEQAERLGARVFRSADVKALARERNAWRVETGRGTVRAGRVVNAAGPWAHQVGALVGLDLPVYSAPLQMIVTERAPVLVEQLVGHADRHLSLKQLASGGIVIGGAWTARYSESQNMNVTVRDSIEGNLWVANRVLPQLTGLHVLRTWAGMNVNIDGAPIVGEAPGAPGVFNAVTSNGYTLAPAVARLTADLICRGRADHDIRPYQLDRFDKVPS